MAVVLDLCTDSAAAYELTVVAHGPSRTTICAAGELDLAARSDLADVLRQHQGERGHIVQLDLSKVTFFDCSCLGVLVGSHDRSLEHGGMLVLTGLSGAVARVVTLTGLGDTLSIVPDGQDPFGSVVMTRVARRPMVSEQRRPVVATDPMTRLATRLEVVSGRVP